MSTDRGLFGSRSLGRADALPAGPGAEPADRRLR
jgi:hypothetical protein